MEWDLLCPRCRGAKLRVRHLHELPDATVAAPTAGRRTMPARPSSTPHVRFQAEVAAGSRRSFALTLPVGPHRFRTVEAGAEADAMIGSDGMIAESRQRHCFGDAWPQG
jgi:hypothetical protein